MKFVWAVLLVLVVGLGGSAWWVNAAVNRPAGDNATSEKFIVKKGEGVRTVAAHLANAQLVASARAWSIYIVTSGLRANLLPGEYDLNSTMTGRQVAKLLTTDQTTKNDVTVKVLEGATADEIGAQLEKYNVMKKTDFLAAVDVRDSRKIVPDRYYEFLTDKPTTVGLEGFLFPDTYRFFQHATTSAVLRKFLDNFNVKYKPDTRQEVKASGRTYYQTVIMASILEAELKTDVDRAMAADIFWRRLKAGIALQADTTVIYALGGGKSTLTLKDLEVDSPYNTYKYPGLPIGPIGNPGLSALRAAAHPTANNYWYYLTGKDGKTYFGKTLDEHNRNKQLYL